MKRLKILPATIKTVMASVCLTFLTLLVKAQDEKKVDININTKSDNWYAQPWVWVVGGAVFILLLVALLRGGKRSD